MGLRFPITLWRHTLLDLLKLIAISTSVLVLVIAIGGAVKPLSDGVLQPTDLPKFLLIACVPMLSYALPFAAGFAATLVYYRIAHENEAIAAHAGGISHRALLAPAMVTAVLLTGLMLLLNERVIPSFLRSMAQMVSLDVARQVMRGVEKNQAVSLKGAGAGSVESRLMIYADGAQALAPDPDSGATDEILLRKFAAVELGRDGQPVTEVTAATATMWLYPGNLVEVKDGSGREEGRSLVFMRLEDVAAVQQGKWSGGTKDKVDFTWTVPNTFNEKVAFLSYAELKALDARPEGLNWMEANRQRLLYALAESQAIEQFKGDIGAERALEFTDSNGKGVTVRAGSISGTAGRWELLPVEGGVIAVDETRRTEGGEGPATITAARGALINDTGAGPGRLEFRLELERARVREAGAPEAAAQVERAMVTVPGLKPSPNPADAMQKMSVGEVVDHADEWAAARGAPEVSRARSDVVDALARLRNGVLSQQHDRVALALSCAVVVLTGAITALLLSRRLPLTVYLWTFFPAVASMVTISGGQQATNGEGASGLILMWSGVVGLGLYSLFVFRILARH